MTKTSQLMNKHFLTASLLAVILLAVFIRLVHADLSYEKNMLERVPRGH